MTSFAPSSIASLLKDATFFILIRCSSLSFQAPGESPLMASPSYVAAIAERLGEPSVNTAQLLFTLAWIEIGEGQADKHHSSKHVSSGAVEEVVQRFAQS